MIYPVEILRNSYHYGRKDLSDFVYTEYLQMLIVKFINEVSNQKPYFLFGATLNRLGFDRAKFGNTLNFFTENKSVKDFNSINEQIKVQLVLEGYTVKINKKSKFEYSFNISSKDFYNPTTNKHNIYKVNIIYYLASKYFKPTLFKTMTACWYAEAYDVHSLIDIIDFDYSLSTLLRVVFVKKSIQPIELYDIYKLTTSHMQLLKQNFFKPTEQKNLKTTLSKIKQKLGNQKIKDIDSKSFYIIDEYKIEEFFNFNNWINRLSI